MPPSQLRNRALSPGLVLCLALIGASSMAYYHLGFFIPRGEAIRKANDLGNGYSFGNDFYQVWLTSRALIEQRENPYSVKMTREIQTGLYGRPLDSSRGSDPIDQRVFPYPAFTDLLFLPTAQVSFVKIRVLVVCALAVLTVVGTLLWVRALAWPLDWRWTLVAVLLVLCSYPALEGLYAGQLGLLVSFLLAATIWALKRGRFLLAGTLLALTIIKPQVAVLAIVYLLLWSLHDWRGRRWFLAGFLSVSILLIGCSLLIMPQWPQSWMRTILAYRRYTTPPLIREVLTSLLGPHLADPATLILTAIAIFIAVTLAWRNRTAHEGSFAFFLTLSTLLAITTITLLPGQAVYDHLILIPGILLLTERCREITGSGGAAHILSLICGFILIWPWIAAFALILLHPWMTFATFNSTSVLSLPIRTAASLPFAVLALLGWVWRIKVAKRPATA